jgi:hypothetical protein
VEQLRDDNLETYWQSDGAQPHCVTVQFLRKVSLSEVCVYLDFNLDESYAPKKICVSYCICVSICVCACEFLVPLLVCVRVHVCSTLECRFVPVPRRRTSLSW